MRLSVPHLRPFPRPLRLALQFFVSHGPRRGLRLLAGRLRSRPSLQSTPFDLFPRRLPAATHPFDLQYHVDTSGFRHGEDLGQPASTTGTPPDPLASPSPRILPSTLWNTAYYGIAPSLFDAALSLLGASPAAESAQDAQDVQSVQAHAGLAPSGLSQPPPVWSRFTFVDLGCGKGRALLLASRLPFRGILGVELDPTLAAIAQANLRTFHAPWQQCHTLRALHGDATAIDLPLTPLLLYLYHPFLAPALKRVLRRLEQSLRQHPRELWLVYINPEAAHVLRGFPFLREHLRTVVAIAAEDALPDRLGSSEEEVAIFHALPPA